MEHGTAYSNRGEVKRVKGDLDGAIADLNKAIEIDPNCAVAYNNRSEARLQKGDLAGALADYDRAAELKPEFAAKKVHLSKAERAKGDRTILDIMRAAAKKQK